MDKWGGGSFIVEMFIFFCFYCNGRGEPEVGLYLMFNKIIIKFCLCGLARRGGGEGV